MNAYAQPSVLPDPVRWHLLYHDMYGLCSASIMCVSGGNMPRTTMGWRGPASVSCPSASLLRVPSFRLASEQLTIHEEVSHGHCLPCVSHALHNRRAPVVDAQLLTNMKMKQFVGHAPKPAHLHRNQVPYDLRRESRASVPESPMMRGTCVQCANVVSMLVSPSGLSG